MARINRTDVIQKAVNDLALSTSGEIIPNQTLDKVQCVYSLNNHYSNFVSAASRSSSGTNTITLPAGKEFYLTGLDVGLAKDATNDAATGSFDATITPADIGIGKNIILIPFITLTAMTAQKNLQFTHPIKLKTGSTITTTLTHSVGASATSIIVTGYLVSSN